MISVDLTNGCLVCHKTYAKEKNWRKSWWCSEYESLDIDFLSKRKICKPIKEPSRSVVIAYTSAP